MSDTHSLTVLSMLKISYLLLYIYYNKYFMLYCSTFSIIYIQII